MSLQIKVKVPKSAKIIAKLRQIHSTEFIEQVQAEVVDGSIKKLIASGQSPVEGFGRFVQYKDRKKYPNKKKEATPVNLTLHGIMLKLYYVARRKSDFSMIIGIAPEAPEAIKIRAKANNEGTFAHEGLAINKQFRGKLKERNLPLFRKGRKKTSVSSVVQGNKGIPARRFIPINGENFTISVITKIKNLYAKRVRTLLSNS